MGVVGEPLMIMVHACTLSLSDELRVNSSIGALEIKKKIQTWNHVMQLQFANSPMTTLDNKTTKTQPKFDQFKTWEWSNPYLWIVINKKEKKTKTNLICELWSLMIREQQEK